VKYTSNNRTKGPSAFKFYTIKTLFLTLICFKWPENVDKDCDKDCSSPMSAKTESNQGIFADSEART